MLLLCSFFLSSHLCVFVLLHHLPFSLFLSSWLFVYYPHLLSQPHIFAVLYIYICGCVCVHVSLYARAHVCYRYVHWLQRGRKVFSICRTVHHHFVLFILFYFLSFAYSSVLLLPRAFRPDSQAIPWFVHDTRNKLYIRCGVANVNTAKQTNNGNWRRKHLATGVLFSFLASNLHDVYKTESAQKESRKTHTHKQVGRGKSISEGLCTRHNTTSTGWPGQAS